MSQDALRQAKLDAVDQIVEQWQRERADLDSGAKHVTGRVIRLASLFRARYAESFATLGLNDGDYGVLATLRRAGAPHRLTPGELARHQMMSTGGMTVAIDRLERKGLVTRRANPEDRRGSLVELTPAGLALVDRAMELQVEAEAALVAGLSRTERRTLEQLLRKLLLAVDDQA